MNGRFTRIRWTPAKRNKITGEIWVPDKLRLRETFQINQWGNLNKILPYPGKPQPENLNQMAGNNNRFTGMSYDAAGNLLNDGASTYFYDAENRIQTGVGVTYTYDGDGKRVQKSTGKLYWYGVGTDPLDESDASGNLTDEYVFFGGKRMARRNVSSGNIFYYLADHLGTSRVILQAGQTIPCYDADFYPFGGERIVTNTCPQNYKFTGKERDSEGGLDNFTARYNSSSLGRFMSPDPANFGAIDESPQTWNAYSYVGNNPLSAVDPDGLDCIYTSNRTESSVEVTIVRGDCKSDTDNGVYVNGTVNENSLTYNGSELGYSISNAEEQTGGAGTIYLGQPPSTNSSNSGQLNPFAQGVFSQLNKMPIQKFIFVVYGGSVALGATGGAACYYFCPEAAATTLAGETGTDLIASTNALNKIIGGSQRELLKQLFKTGDIPEGLSQRTLQIYKEVAQRAIAAGKDASGLQRIRIQIIDAALKAMR